MDDDKKCAPDCSCQCNNIDCGCCVKSEAGSEGSDDLNEEEGEEEAQGE